MYSTINYNSNQQNVVLKWIFLNLFSGNEGIMWCEYEQGEIHNSVLYRFLIVFIMFGVPFIVSDSLYNKETGVNKINKYLSKLIIKNNK